MDTKTTDQPAEADHQKSVQATVEALQKQADDETSMAVTRLNLAQISQLRQEVAEIFPAQNTAALVLSGLLKLKGRVLTQEVAEIFMRPLLTYSALIAAPALALSAYQKLLQLAGKDVESAFPEGTWQFYLQFGLREDEARHVNETVGFHRAIPEGAGEVEMVSAWLCQIARAYFDYDLMLANEWSERVLFRAVDRAIEEKITAENPDLSPDQLTVTREQLKRHWQVHDLSEAWLSIRPYRRDPKNSPESYPESRWGAFLIFFNNRLERLPEPLRQRVWEQYTERSAQGLSAYQKQMSILYALKPERFNERKDEIPLWKSKIAFIYQGRYYLLGACSCDSKGRPLIYDTPQGDEGWPSPVIIPEEEGRPLLDRDKKPLVVGRDGQVWLESSPDRRIGWLRPISPASVRRWTEKVLKEPPRGIGQGFPVTLALAEAQRGEQRNLRSALSPEVQAVLKQLRQAPVILNWDLRDADSTLSEIRRGWRGIGDQAMTIFRTERSFVFDQSHIFYDGVWGMAFAEIVTNGAAEFYEQVAGLSSQQPDVHSREAFPTPISLHLDGNMSFFKMAAAARVHREVAAENDRVDLEEMIRLRRLLKKRNVAMTINDLLLLYRTLHDGQYRPTSELEKAVGELEKENRPFKTISEQNEPLTGQQVGALLRQTWEKMATRNPCLLIPMDASYIDPKERIFPTTFRSPVPDLLPLYQRSREIMIMGTGDLAPVRNGILERLAVFSGVLTALKEMTRRGYSFNVAVVRLMAYLPPAMQYVLDLIPQKITVLNEIIKGEEVFSNVGRVAKGSSLSRFTSAKDDGETKELVWGFITDDQGRLHISLRDFRPHVRPLLLNSYEELAKAITQDYLDAYSDGLNCFARDLVELME